MHNTFLPGWITPFLAGVFVSTLVLTHDGSVGNELIVRGLLRGGGDRHRYAFSADARVTSSSSSDTTKTTTRTTMEQPPPGQSHPAGELPSAELPVYRGNDAVLAKEQEEGATTTEAAAVVEEDAKEKAEEEGVARRNANNDSDADVGYNDADADAADADAADADDGDADENPEEYYSYLNANRAFAETLSTREAIAAAMASTKLAMALWARAARPVTDSLTFYAGVGYQEFITHSWRFLTTTDPRVLAAAVAAVVALLCVYAAVVAIARHLKRARYLARLKAAGARLRERLAAFWRRLTGPYVRAFRRVREFGRGVTVRYNSFLAGVRAKSRRAAALAPHVILAAFGGAVIFFLPDETRTFVRKREVVASVVLLVPTFLTVAALERCRDILDNGGGGDDDEQQHNKTKSGTGAAVVKASSSSDDGGGGGGGKTASGDGKHINSKSGGGVGGPNKKLTAEQQPPATGTAAGAGAGAGARIGVRLRGSHAGEEAAEAWLRFWASAAPLMLLIDLPFVARGLHLLFPWWPECALLWTAWQGHVSTCPRVHVSINIHHTTHHTNHQSPITFKTHG